MLFYKLAEVCLQPIIPPKHSPPSLPYPLITNVASNKYQRQFLGESFDVAALPKC